MPVFAADTESSSAEIPVQPQISKNEPQDILDESVENILTETEPLALLEDTLGDCKILQHVDADSFAQANHAFRMPELETMDTYVFQNNDGTRSVYYMNEAVKFTDSLGNIREKDLTLRAETRGYRMGENEFDLFLPFSIADGVALTYEGYEVKLAPTGGNALATLQNNAVVYDEYFGAGTSLRYTPMLSGVKEEIILDNYVPDRTFTFVLLTDGLFLVEQDGRYVLAEDKEGIDVVLYLGEIVVYDAIGKPSVGTVTVETIKEGLGYALTVSADEAFLSDPTTVYPVTIDPDLTVKDTASSTGLVEDCPIYSGMANVNHGNYIYLTAGYTDDTYKIGRTVFRLPGLYNNASYQAIGSWEHISSVKFYCWDASGNSSRHINLYRCLSSWTESTLTWNNFGGYSATTDFGTIMVPNAYTVFDITRLVQDWKKGTCSATAGFVLINPDETEKANKKAPFSSEYSNTERRPYVIMTYRTGINLSKTSLSMNVGETASASVTSYTPSSSGLQWSTSNSRVATVNPLTGVITAKACGRIAIKVCLTADPTISATVTVTVNAPTLPTSGIENGCIYMIKNTSTGKYLMADSDTETLVMTDQKDEMSGSQLWYVEWSGNGYIIYSLGIKELDSYGAYETVLRGVSANKMPTFAYELASYRKWVISLYNGKYYITNNNFLNTSLSINSSGEVRCLTLTSENNYARWEFEKIELRTFNNYVSGTYRGQGTVKYLKIEVNTDYTSDSRIGRNGYYNLTHFDVIDEWKNISGNIVIYNVGEDVPASINPFSVVFEGYTPEPREGEESLNVIRNRAGETQGYRTIFGIDVRTDFFGDWDFVKCYINTDSFSKVQYLGDDDKKKILAHEFGHVLKLNHPKETEYNVEISNGRGSYSSDSSVCALMNQDTPSDSGNLTCMTPKWHDIINMRNKWGN